MSSWKSNQIRPVIIFLNKMCSILAMKGSFINYYGQKCRCYAKFSIWGEFCFLIIQKPQRFKTVWVIKIKPNIYLLQVPPKLFRDSYIQKSMNLNTFTLFPGCYLPTLIITILISCAINLIPVDKICMSGVMFYSLQFSNAL